MKQIKLEKDLGKKQEFVEELRSRVCNRENWFVCCPVDEQRQTKLEPIESPSFLPTPGECGNVEEKPTILVGGVIFTITYDT